MKIATFSLKGSSEERLGFVLPSEQIVDALAAWNGLAAAARPQWNAKASPAEVFASALSLLRNGPDALAAARRLAEAAEAANVGLLPLNEVRLRAPIGRPGKILAIGRNYGDHLKESQALWKAKGQVVAKSAFPTGFFKAPSTVIGPEEDIIYPLYTEQLDYEVEMAVVIGRECKNIDPSHALEYVAGYTVGNDVSAREVQFSEQGQKMGPTLGKNFDTFCPLGPWITLASDIPDPSQLEVELRVNGEVRQHSSTADLVFNVPELIAYWSRMRLEPGDIILTGTPGGVAVGRPDPSLFYLKPGDVVEATVSQIGTLRNTVVAEPAN